MKKMFKNINSLMYDVGREVDEGKEVKEVQQSTEASQTSKTTTYPLEDTENSLSNSSGNSNFNRLMQDEKWGRTKSSKAENNQKNKKEKEAMMVALMVRYFIHEYNDYNIINYINLSEISSIGAEDAAAVVLMVGHQPDELDLHPRRNLGSIPSRSASASLSSEKFVKQSSANINFNRLMKDEKGYAESKEVNKNEANRENKKEKEAFEVASKVKHVYTDYNNYNDSKYINIFNKKEKRVNDVTLEVRKFFTDYNYYSNINYINVSIYNFGVEDAPVTLVVRDRPLKSDLHRYPSSILGWSASTNSNLNTDISEQSSVDNNFNSLMQDGGRELYAESEEASENEANRKNKKEKRVKNLTLTVSIFSQDHNNSNRIKYINLSYNYHNDAEDAELILTVRNQSEKLGLLTRQLGSTPRLGESSALFNNFNNLININISSLMQGRGVEENSETGKLSIVTQLTSLSTEDSQTGETYLLEDIKRRQVHYQLIMKGCLSDSLSNINFNSLSQDEKWGESEGNCKMSLSELNKRVIDNSGNWNTICPEFSNRTILKNTALINRIVHNEINQANISTISRVLNTLTLDCSLNACSLDQIEQLRNNANAKTGTSLSCGEICLADDSSFLKDSSGIKFKNDSNSDNFSLKCFSFNPEYLSTSDLFFFNSSIIYCDENKCKLRDLDLDISSLTGFGLKNDTNMFVSTTNLIVYQPSFFNRSQALVLILSPILRASSSETASDSSCFNICSFQVNLSTLDSMHLRTNPDQFISGKFSILRFISSGIDNVIDTILITHNLVNKHRYVEIFKSFGKKDLSRNSVKDKKENRMLQNKKGRKI